MPGVDDSTLTLSLAVDGLDTVKGALSEEGSQINKTQQEIINSNKQVQASFENIGEKGIFALHTLQEQVAKTAIEIGGLRSELLNTQDVAKRLDLEAKLEDARARYGALRSELRGMNLEMREARETSLMMNEALGIKIPASMEVMIAKFPMARAAMSSAFEAAVVLAVVDAVIQLGEKIIDVTHDLAGFSESVKKQYEDVITENRKLETSFKDAARGAEYLRNAQHESVQAQDKTGYEAVAKSIQSSNHYVNALTYGVYGLVVAYKEHKKAVDEVVASTKLQDEIVGQMTKNSVADEEKNFRKSVDATKAGSQERVNVIQAEYDKFRHSGEQFASFREHLEEELTTNTREHSEQEARAAEEAQRKHQAALKATQHAYDEFMAKVAANYAQLGRTLEEQAHRDREVTQQDLHMQLQAVLEETKEEIDLYKAVEQGYLQHQKALLEIKKVELAEEVSEHKISKQKELQLLAEYEKKVYEDELQALNAEIATYDYGTKKWQDALNKRQALTDAYNLHVAQSALKSENLEESAIAKMTSTFNNSVTAMITGQDTLATAWQKTWQSMLGALSQNLLKMTEQMIVAELEHKALAQTSILVDAKKAAAGAYSSMAGIPIVGPELGAIAAAVTFAAVMAFGSFSKGGVVPQDMAAIVHEGEGVLTSDQTQALLAAASGGGFERGGSLHINAPMSVNSIDSTGISGMLSKHQNSIVREVRRAMRNGKLAFS